MKIKPAHSSPLSRHLSPLGVIILSAVMALLAACGPVRKEASERTEIANAQRELSETRLLDVSIETFSIGSSEEKTDGPEIPRQVHEAEARFIPVHLKKTLQDTGYWGAVRVIPRTGGSGTSGYELLVRGEIKHSDGEVLELQITALDASGRRWLQKDYRAQTNHTRYRGLRRGQGEAFQSLYNRIANDLAQFKRGLKDPELVRIRQISELRFAADIAPDAFGNYVERKADGRWQVRRLPATNDPMIKRIRKVRDRDYLLVDTINAHYDRYYDDLWESYRQFRKERSKEAEALREVESEATNRKVLGAAAIAGAIAIELFGSNNTRARTGTLRQLAVVGGALAVKSGFDRDKDKAIHVDSLDELNTSFEADSEPLVVKVDGNTVRLTGSAEAQYEQWRATLKRIYAHERGAGDLPVVSANQP